MVKYKSFRVRVFPDMSLKEFIKDSPFEKPFHDYETLPLPHHGAPCIAGCGFTFKVPSMFERHIQTVHAVIFLSHIKCLLDSLGIAYPGSSNSE